VIASPFSNPERRSVPIPKNLVAQADAVVFLLVCEFRNCNQCLEFRESAARLRPRPKTE
jgi:hypothetical protein